MPLLEVDLLRFAQECLRAQDGFFFAERCAGCGLGERMPDCVERTIRTDDDGVLFRITVPEITHAPKRARHFLVIDSVYADDANSPPQELICERVQEGNKCRGRPIAFGS